MSDQLSDGWGSGKGGKKLPWAVSCYAKVRRLEMVTISCSARVVVGGDARQQYSGI